MMQRTFRGERASELFPVLAYAPGNGLFLLDDQSLGFGWVCQPLAYADQATFERILGLINLEWPASTLLQAALWSSPDIIEQMAGMEELRLHTRDPLLKEATRRTAAFLREATTAPLKECGDLRVRDLQLLVTVKLPLAAPTPTETEHREAAELRATAEQVLATAGLRPAPLSADRYVRILQAMLNWGEHAGWRDRIVPECDSAQVIARQLLDYETEVFVDGSGISIGGQRVQSLSVKRFPDRAAFGVATRYLGDPQSGTRGIPHNALIALNVHFPDPEATRMKLTTRSQWAAHQSGGHLAHYLPSLAERKREFDELFRVLDDGDRPVQVYLGVLLFSRPEEAASALSNARTYFREIGFQLMPDRHFALPLILNCLPFGADRGAVGPSLRYRTVGASHAVILAPFFGDWKGTGSPVVQLLGRKGQLMHFDLYAAGSGAAAGNYNAVIAATSGSGKSFLANELIATNLAVGGRCWVIDVGRSYEKLCESLGGQFIEFTAAAQVVVNPFELVGDWSQEGDMIAGLLETMAAPRKPLDDFRKAALKRVLSEQWAAHGRALTIDRIAEALRADADKRVRDVGAQLFAFTSAGDYGHYFAGRNTVAFTSDLVVLELEELKTRKHLQQVVLLALIYQIQQAMYVGFQGAERGRRKLLMVDEAWDLLTSGAVGTFIMEGYRRFRKYNGSAVVATQSLADLYDNPNGRAIAANTAHTLLLRQPAQLIDQLLAEKRLPLSKAGAELLKTVHTISGAYSEIMIVSEAGDGIGRLVVDPFRRLLYSTRAEDVAALAALRAQGLPVGEAIEQLLQARRHG